MSTGHTDAMEQIAMSATYADNTRKGFREIVISNYLQQVQV
jgi:hypothetical protein